jgi:hypothetical protein
MARVLLWWDEEAALMIRAAPTAFCEATAAPAALSAGRARSAGVLWLLVLWRMWQ